MNFLTAGEVAKMLRMSQWFVYKNFELFGGIKIGRVLRFEKETVEGIINGHLEVARQRAVQVQLHKGPTEIPEPMVQNGGGGEKSGEKSPRKTRGDKYGLYRSVYR